MKGITGAGGDPHNLWPSIAVVNSARQHWRLVDDIPGEISHFAARSEPELSDCGFERQHTGSGAVVEPALAALGPLARSILHMTLAYPAMPIKSRC